MPDSGLFTIQLEDCTRSRWTCGLATYLGTREDLQAFAQRLAEAPHVAKRYARTIEGIDGHCLNPDATHIMSGRELPVLTPAREVARREHEFGFVDWYWDIPSCVGSTIKCSSGKLEMLLAESGGRLILGVRGRLDHVRAHQLGHAVSNFDHTDGFPGVCTLEDDTVTQHLFKVLGSCRMEEQEDVLDRMKNPSGLNLTYAFADALPRLYVD